MKPLITPLLNEFLQLAKQGNVIPVFAEFVGDCETPVSAFKKFSGSAFSFLFESTDLAARQDDLLLPEMLFMLTGNVLIFDHRLRSLKILVNAFLDGGSPEKVYARAVESLDSIMQQLSEPTDLPLVPVVDGEKQPPPRSNFRREDFQRAVERAKEYIRAGDIFQVVLSQRFESPFNGAPLDFYR